MNTLSMWGGTLVKGKAWSPTAAVKEAKYSLSPAVGCKGIDLWPRLVQLDVLGYSRP